MKILITGITGFVGSRLERFFSSEDEIFVLVRPSAMPFKGNARLKIIQGDLNTPAGIIRQLKEIRPDVCLHLAWEGIPDYGYDVSWRNLQQGVVLLRGLVEECGCGKIIVVGSCFEYGKTFGACREDDLVVISSYFVWAKHALCNLGMLLAEKYQISFVWMRFFYVYGPGQRAGSLIPTIATALRKGEKLNIKTPLNANDFVFVDDVAEALLLAARKDIPTGIYNLGTGVSVPVWRVCEIVEKFLGREPVCTGELKNSSIPAAVDFWADTEKTEKALGWRAGISLERGIAQYVKSLGENG